MNARSCQLCGKPLSRIWVGSGGDFCSREHRNQYRLRRGMDRLLEENKVASLMRRRENPKLLSIARRASDYAIAHRGFFEGRIAASRRAAAPLPHRRPVLRTHIPAGPGNYLSPRPVGQSPMTVNRAAAPPPSVSRATAAGLPRRRPTLPVQVPQARAVPLGKRIFGSRARRREFSLLQSPANRVHLGGGILRSRRGGASGSCLVHQPQGAHAVQSRPQRGHALRVSSGVGFRLPPPRQRAVKLPAPADAALVWSHGPRDARPGLRPLEGAFRFARVDVATAQVSYPPSPACADATYFRWPGVLPAAARPSLVPALGRPSAAPWNTSAAAQMPHLRHSPAPANAVFPEPDVLRLFALPVRPVCPHNGSRRVGLANFVPQDSPFAVSPIGILGSLSPAPPAPLPAPFEKVQPSSAAPKALEERFDSGWSNWIGGMDDWKLDVAGVRTGSLALFRPSLEMRDYELQFLARIESRSLTWVFRATGLKEYYAATISIAPAGGYQFTRRPVGAPGSAVGKPLRIAHAAKAAVTVITRVRGSEFAVSIDGQTVDTWTDARFPKGGIGFVGAPDDRARLYWVRISTDENSSKENRKP